MSRKHFDDTLLKDVLVVILSHGRPRKQTTYSMLKKYGYRGDIVILCDNLDETLEEYRQLYPGIIHVFDKNNEMERSDSADNFRKTISSMYARNASFDVAKNLGYKYFLQLDDDYNEIRTRVGSDLSFRYKASYGTVTEQILSLVKFLQNTGVDAVCMSQGGDWLGGAKSFIKEGVRMSRKAMNSFVFRTSSHVRFSGLLNEDTNLYTSKGRAGCVFITYLPLSINQIATQRSPGGMTPAYLESGTYVKSFYSVVHAPSCVKISTLGFGKRSRIHHKVSWENCAVKIVPESLRRT